jgi:mono/diheme cytochrome c family protein
MPISRLGSICVGASAVIALGACSANQEWEPAFEQTSANLSAAVRLAACAEDPRVVAGLVTQAICAGADIFFRETFEGNGRTCGSCHAVDNNMTVDAKFINELHRTNPSDPLFIFERDPNLTMLETAQLFNGGVLENVDDFRDPTRKFVHRSVPHVLSLATSLAPDPTDRTTNPPAERTGWSGDGAPGNGTLREFLSGAVEQHYPKTLARVPGVDFRVPTSEELDLALAFQLSLGRLNEIDLTQVRLADADAEEGRKAYLDPGRGRCNFCHANGGANSELNGKNSNFDTGTRFRPVFGAEGTLAGGPLFDGGFGGQNLDEPNILTFPLFPGDTTPNGLGDNTFNTPPVIEAADTLPGFHNDSAPTPEAIVPFYITEDFRKSKASADLIARFGTPIEFTADDGDRMARFMRIINAAFNLDIAKQRLEAAQTLANQFHDTRADIQLTLMRLAEEEIDDALLDLDDGLSPAQPCYPVAQDRLALAKAEIRAGLAATSWSQRQSRISTAISRVVNARDQFGSNMNFQLGKGNLMF